MPTVKATKQIIDWDAENGCAVVINAGETGELSDAMAEKHKDSWKTSKPQLDHDDNGKAGGSKPKKERKAAKSSGDPELGAARKRYRDVFGKNPGPKWDIATIDAKIAEKQSEGVDDAGDEDDGAPAE